MSACKMVAGLTDCDDAASLELVKTFTPSPSITVASGGSHRRHFYWILKDPLPPGPHIEELLRGIRACLKSDVRTDISSMMQIAVTFLRPGVFGVEITDSLSDMGVDSDTLFQWRVKHVHVGSPDHHGTSLISGDSNSTALGIGQ